jgi:hypothetical protein
MIIAPNDLLLAAPVCAWLSFLRQWPGAPEHRGSAESHVHRQVERPGLL